MPTCLIGLGSNLGARDENLNRAVALLDGHDRLRVTRVSRWYATRPVGGPLGQSEFLNGAATLETSMSAEDLLALIHRIEAAVGRERTARWEPRLVDLDLLLFGDCVIQQPHMRVPHPWMAFRPFVLAPANEIAPDLIHPELHWNIGRLHLHARHRPPIMLVISEVPGHAREIIEQLSAKGVSVLDSYSADAPRLASWPTSKRLELLTRRARCLTDRLAQLPTSRSECPRDVVVGEWWDDPLREFYESSTDGAVAEFQELVENCSSLIQPPQVTVAISHEVHRTPVESNAADAVKHYVRRPNGGPWIEFHGNERLRILRDVQAILDGFHSVVGPA